MSNSLQPQGLYSPWNSLSQKTGVGSFSLLQGIFPTDWTQVSRIAGAAEPQGKPKNTGVGSLSLLQRIFPIQESNQGLLPCRWTLCQLSYQGSTTLSRTNTQKRYSLHHRGLECKSRKSRDTWNSGQFGLGVQNELVKRTCPFPTTQETTLHMDITRWLILKWDCSRRWSTSIQPAETRSGAHCGSVHQLLIAHFSLKFEKVGKTTMPFKVKKVKVKIAQSCLTLCHPMDCSPPGSSVHGILQARVLEWVTFSFSSGSSQPRDQTQVSFIAGRFFTSWAIGKTRNTGVGSLTLLQQIFPTQPFRYDLNQVPYDYSVEETLID